jgi:N4-gp56 family major capsid protein
MTVTTSAILDNSVVTQYDTDYILNFHLNELWAKLMGDTQRRKVSPSGAGKKGKTVQMAVYEDLEVPTSHLTENLDVTPKTLGDGYVECTIYEEGDVIQSSRFLSLVAYTDLHSVYAKALAKQHARRQDDIVRDAIVFAQQRTIYGGAGTSRVGLNTTDHKLTFAKFQEAYGMAVTQGIPPLEDGTYFTIMNSMAMLDVVGWDEFKYPAMYSMPEVYQNGLINKEGKLPFEVGRFANIRILSHPTGKMFLGAGAPTQAATSLSAATAAGATSITVPNATGLGVGNKITVGPLESSTTAYVTTEQCEVTAVDGTTLTVKGAGSEFGNYGLKYAHDAGESVIEAPNVLALPILGPESFLLPRAEGFDIEGEVEVKWADSRIGKRFMDHSWYNILGAALIPKFSLQIEAATTGWVYGPA